MTAEQLLGDDLVHAASVARTLAISAMLSLVGFPALLTRVGLDTVLDRQIGGAAAEDLRD